MKISFLYFIIFFIQKKCILLRTNKGIGGLTIKQDSKAIDSFLPVFIIFTQLKNYLGT